MKKTIVFALLLFLLVGCTYLEQDNDISDELSSEIDASSNVELSSAAPTTSLASSPTELLDDMSTSFFFPKSLKHIKYNGYISFDGDYTKVSFMLQIAKKEELENLYELFFDKIEGIPDDRLNLGYFYVDNKTIYRLKIPLEGVSNISYELIVLNSDIVCCEQPIDDEIDNEDRGIHRSLKVFNEKCESYFYNNQVETGFYEAFVWELGKGLIEYKSGFGAERDSIHIIMD